ncbi:Aste57867_12071 [Aphanomyces stellatus]|uniref:Aste57867_12071 protein n=1 Tax=Aphanomyces stellatus TaxID=120398 RepID=A0A485KWL7_9STRA|nr:hypothetical protein As57867_012026 [Aphanomyces stellatus]VFT88926.1 Aste57867_12071 [Aphanomyces stellatus]
MDDLQQYSFAAKPRAVRGKYRDKKANKYVNTTHPGADWSCSSVFNIMTDPRVARGSVFAAANSIHIQRENVRAANQQPPPSSTSNGSTRMFKKQTIYEPPVTLQTYFPVDLEKNLIEQTPQVHEMHAATQTDAFVANDKHKKPFVLKKTGVDAATEIAATDRLFDFDMEVQPMLTVLVNKTMKQALCEVEREEELKTIESYVSTLHDRQSVEAESIRDLVEHAKKAYMAKAMEKDVAQKRRAEMEEVERKVAAASLSRFLLDQVTADTTAVLTAEGVYYDPLRRHVESNFLPWVYGAADARVRVKRVGLELTQDVVAGSLRQQRMLTHIVSLRDALGFVSIACSHKPEYGVTSIGPLPYTSSLAEMEALAQAWMREKAPTVPRPSGGFLVDVLAAAAGINSV